MSLPGRKSSTAEEGKEPQTATWCHFPPLLISLPVFPPVTLPPYEPNVPEPTTRPDFMKCAQPSHHIHVFMRRRTCARQTGSYLIVFSLPPSDWVPLSMDERTAQKLLWISQGGAKVARTSDAVCPYPNRPERYEHSPQVAPPTAHTHSA